MRKGKHQSIIGGIFVIALLTVGLGSCSKTGTTVSNSAVTYVSVMNMAPYAPAMDIYLNGSLSSATGGIPPGKFSLQYSHLAPGTYDVMFKKTGVDSLMAEIPASLYDTADFSTLILYNATGSTAASAARIKENFSTVSNYNANYRFFNLAPDAPAVDFSISGTVAQPNRINADNVANPSFNIFQQIPAATYNLSVRATGVTPDSVIANISGANLQPGGVYTIFLTETRIGTTNSYSLNILTAAF